MQWLQNSLVLARITHLPQFGGTLVTGEHLLGEPRYRRHHSHDCHIDDVPAEEPFAEEIHRDSKDDESEYVGEQIPVVISVVEEYVQQQREHDSSSPDPID